MYRIIVNNILVYALLFIFEEEKEELIKVPILKLQNW